MIALSRFSSLRALPVALLLPAMAAASTAKADTVSLPSYLHSGPGKHYRVVGELDRGAEVDVLSCNGDWCRVRYDRAENYLPKEVLKNSPVAAISKQGNSATGAGCFHSKRSGYGGGIIFNYCPQ